MKTGFFPGLVIAVGSALYSADLRAEQKLVEPEKAFKINATLTTGRSVKVEFSALDGYYFYHDRFSFESDNATVKVVKVALPAGQVKYEEVFDKLVRYHRGTFSATVLLAGPAIPITLTVKSQGCADAGVCYPPVNRSFSVPGASR